MTPAFVPLAPATDTAFFVVFGLFVVALVVLAVIIIVWAVRNDIAGRRAWRARQGSRGTPARRVTPSPHPSRAHDCASNGRPGPNGEHARSARRPR